jgi:hypothetical protein
VYLRGGSRIVYKYNFLNVHEIGCFGPLLFLCSTIKCLSYSLCQYSIKVFLLRNMSGKIEDFQTHFVSLLN